jgi:hypothetical protein
MMACSDRLPGALRDQIAELAKHEVSPTYAHGAAALLHLMITRRAAISHRAARVAAIAAE